VSDGKRSQDAAAEITSADRVAGCGIPKKKRDLEGDREGRIVDLKEEWRRARKGESGEELRLTFLRHSSRDKKGADVAVVRGGRRVRCVGGGRGWRVSHRGGKRRRGRKPERM